MKKFKITKIIGKCFFFLIKSSLRSTLVCSQCFKINFFSKSSLIFSKIIFKLKNSEISKQKPFHFSVLSTSAHQHGANKQQLSPNHPPLQLSQSPQQQQSQDSPNSPYNNGSQQLSPSAALNVSGSSSNCGGGSGQQGGQIGPGSSILSPNKYRRSVSFPAKGSSPTPGYNIDSTTTMGNNDGSCGHNYYHQDYHRNGINVVGVGGNSPLESMRPMDHCLNDIIKNMGGGGGGGGDGLNVGNVGRQGPIPIMKNNMGGVGAIGGGMSGVGDHLDEAGKFSYFLCFFYKFLSMIKLICSFLQTLSNNILF